ncbi:hypothetical protein [Microcystis sp. M061S2]|uniref:hypothetical protein n=1 Tax=Microcystis sp. M061S2 TaxID=2771171 RepID=UPI0025905AEC|nr:hypothetical protein [Microcystis sp. M061S2]MCA2656081.1 hypothetical protein [Microcystis sp. M061S2]
MKYICAQPGTSYYAWQIEIMLMNFKEMGIPLQDVHIVCAMHDQNALHLYHQISNQYPEAVIEFYPDTRRTKHYPSSIRPNILKQHFFKHKLNEPFFYHDCDMIFTKKVDFTTFLNDDICYGSDTRFYIGHDYIKSKGYGILEMMASLSGIDVETIKENELNCIGAQYLIKGVDFRFWDEVEKICETLFLNITLENNRIKADNPNYHELQIWTADMWAVLWNLWKWGKQTKVDDYFDFAWATSTIEDWERLNIFHNAGITETGHGFFYKGDYMHKPLNKELQIREKSAQKHYYEYVKKVTIC